MTAKKITEKTENINTPEVVENDLGDATESSPAVREVTETEAMTFTVEVGGEKIELVDQYRKDKVPGAMAMIGRADLAGKYLPGLLESLVGEEQLFMLLDKGLSIEEMGDITKAWADGRGLGGKN